MKKILSFAPLWALCFGCDVYGMDGSPFNREELWGKITQILSLPQTETNKSENSSEIHEKSDKKFFQGKVPDFCNDNPRLRIDGVVTYCMLQHQFSIPDFLDPDKQYGMQVLDKFTSDSDAMRHQILSNALKHPTNADSESFLNVLLELVTFFNDPIEYKRALFECIDCYGRKFYDISAYEYLRSPKFDNPKFNHRAFVEGPDGKRLDILKASLEGLIVGHRTIHDEVLGVFFMFLDSSESLTSDGDSQYLLLARYFKWDLLKRLYPKHKDAWYRTLGDAVKPPRMWDIRKNKNEEIDSDTALRMVSFITGISQGHIQWDFWHDDFPYVVYNDMPLLSSVVFNAKADFLPDIMKNVMKKIKFDASTGLLGGVEGNEELIYPLLAITLRNDMSSNLNTLYASFLDLMDEGATGTALRKFDLGQVAKYFPSLNPEFVKNFKEDPSTHYIKVNAFGAMQLLYSPLFQKILSSENLSAEFFSVTHGIQLNDEGYFPSWLFLFKQENFEILDDLVEKYPRDEFSYTVHADERNIDRFFTKLPVIPIAPNSLQKNEQKKKNGLAWHLMENGFFSLSFISNTNSYLFDAQAERFIYSFRNTAREMDFPDIFEILTQSEPFVRDVFTAAMQQDRIPLLSSYLENAVKAGDFPGVYLLLTLSRELGFDIVDKYSPNSNILDTAIFIQSQNPNLKYLQNIQTQKGPSKKEKQEKMKDESIEREQDVNNILHILGIADHDLDASGDFNSYRERINSLLVEQGAKSSIDPETLDQTSTKPNQNLKGKKKKWQKPEIVIPVEQAPELITEKLESSTESNNDKAEKQENISGKVTDNHENALTSSATNEVNVEKEQTQPELTSKERRRIKREKIQQNLNKGKKKKSNKKPAKVPGETTENSTGKMAERKIEINPIPEPDQIVKSNTTITSTPGQIMIPQNMPNDKPSVSNNKATTTASENAENINNNSNQRSASDANKSKPYSNRSNTPTLSPFSGENLTSSNPKHLHPHSETQRPPKPEIRVVKEVEVVYRYITEQVIDELIGQGKELTPEMKAKVDFDRLCETVLHKHWIEKGYDLDFVAKNGQTVIHYRVKYGTPEELQPIYNMNPVKFMKAVEHKADGDWTATHTAAKHNPRIYHWLLSIEANPNAVDKNQNKPADIFRFYRSKK